MFADTKIGKFQAKVREENLGSALEAVFFWLRMKTGFRKKNPVEERRLELALRLDRTFESTIAYGPFKGMKLSVDGWWVSADRAGMLLGFYEAEVFCRADGDAAAVPAICRPWRRRWLLRHWRGAQRAV